MPTNDHWSPDEQRLVDEVEKELNLRFPRWMEEVVNPYITHMLTQKSGKVFDFSLLYGETQQGKTLVMHLIAWVLTYRYHCVPCYVTKKLAVLRSDAIDKMNNGDLNIIVDEVAERLGVQQLVTTGFGGSRCKIKATSGLTYKGIDRGTIPIFLMDPSNNEKLLKWVRRLAKIVGRPQYPVFIFDEANELYTTTGISSYLAQRKISIPSKKKIGNLILVHKVMEICKQHQCGMIGVTATPQRMFSSDPEVYPHKIFTIPCEPPRPGLVRVGYNDETTQFQGADFHPETDHVAAIRAILAREPVTLTNGQKEVKFLNICTEHENSDMANIHEIISEIFPERVYAKVFMQDTVDYHDINITNLDNFFDLRQIPDQVVDGGVMVLIGKSREGAGITLKPSFGGDKNYEKIIDGQIFTMSNGITDMMVSVGSNMETTEQLIGRASGWYDPNHRLHLWVPEAQIHDIQTGIVLTKRAMMDKYKEGLITGVTGPASVLNIKNMCTQITHLCPNMLYSNTNHRRGEITTGNVDSLDTVQSEIGTNNGYRLNANQHIMPSQIYTKFMKQKDAGGNDTDNRALRNEILDCLRREGVDVPATGNFIQLPWNEARSKEILKAVAQPRGTSQWKVNGYGTIHNEQLVMVIFTQKYDNPLRKRFDYSQDDQYDYVSPNDTVYWYDGKHYQYATFNRDMQHKYGNLIANWVLDDGHQQTLDFVEEIIAKLKDDVRKKSLYNMFVRLHTARYLNNRRPPDMKHQTWISGLWKDFKRSYSTLYSQLNNTIKDAGEDIEEETVGLVNVGLEPYFTANFPVANRIRPVVTVRKPRAVFRHSSV
jgi:hypothetical protein